MKIFDSILAVIFWVSFVFLVTVLPVPGIACAAVTTYLKARSKTKK